MIPNDILNMKNENNYDFRKRMDRIHTPDIRDFSLLAEDDELILSDIAFEYADEFGAVVQNAVLDFQDYMKCSMGVNKGKHTNIILRLSDNLGSYNCYKGYKVSVGDKLEIEGYDERGIAQALYNLEDVLSLRRAPFLKKGEYFRKPMYSPRMVHSGYGFDMYPDSYLSSLAHEGFDAIMVFVRGINQTPTGYHDFNELINRAANFGIDVYAYSNLKSNLGPHEEGAEELYESTYGALFDECPLFKGVILCGESVEFLSRDPNVSGRCYSDNVVDGIPTGKQSPGWYPCCDYPDWLRMIQKIIYKRRTDADIILWSYNWGGAPEEARVALINSLPEGITIQATYEMFECFKLENTVGKCCDYTLSFEGPGKYFSSEAKAAKANGIKLYSMTNTGGATWDFGVVPYLPTPQQWQKRFRGMEHFHDECGLCGLNESHHYGMFPSFISKLAKWTFSEPRIPYDKLLSDIIRIEFGDCVDEITQALEYISDGLTHFTPTNSDQYGAFRIGPSYPFCLNRGYKEVSLQSDDKAVLRGNSVCHIHYVDFDNGNGSTFVGLRVPEEIKSLKKMYELFDKGIQILDSIENKNENLLFLTNQCHFMLHTIVSGINSKKWYMLKCDAKSERNREKLKAIIERMEELLLDERKNAQDSIIYAQKDSRLGWEPSMEYIGDPWHIEWKIRYLDYVLTSELADWKRAADC